MLLCRLYAGEDGAAKCAHLRGTPAVSPEGSDVTPEEHRARELSGSGGAPALLGLLRHGLPEGRPHDEGMPGYEVLICTSWLNGEESELKFVAATTTSIEKVFNKWDISHIR